MKPDLATYRAQQAPRARRQRSPELQARLQQAALAAEYVTRSPEWNGFLALVQQQAKQDQEAIDAIRNVLESEAFLPAERLLELRQQLAIRTAVKQRAEAILAMPAQIQQEAQKTQ